MLAPFARSPAVHAVAKPALAALIVTLAFLACGAVWSVVVPLSSAAIAPGVIGVYSHRKQVQHLEGGIVNAIRVRDGSTVAAGEILLELDPTVANATLDLIQGQYFSLLAEQARLAAERRRSGAIAFPPELVERMSDPRAAASAQAQREVFASRKAAYDSQVRLLEQRIRIAEEQIQGLKDQLQARRRQLEIIAVESRGIAGLVEKGMIRRERLLALRREEARLLGDVGEIRAQIAQSEHRIAETRFSILDLDAKFINQVTGDLREVRRNLADRAERLKAARDVLKRTIIRAPVAGTVVNLKHHTVGGVVAAGAPILDIVPADDELVVEARVDPTDIDVVREGLNAEVRLIALKTRATPSVPGRVITVSADHLVDAATGANYYAAQIRLEKAAIPSDGQTRLYPGMPIEAMIQTGERTFFDYVLGPINDSLARAFREE